MAHGVQHALFAHNAGKLEGLRASQIKTKTVQAGLSRSSIQMNRPYVVASASISAPRRGGAVVMTGVLNPGFQDQGTIGTIFLAVDGTGCRGGRGDAWWDTYSVIAESVSTTMAKPVSAGSHTVKMCAMALRNADIGLTDTSVPFDGGQLTATWVPAAGRTANPSAFSATSYDSAPTIQPASRLSQLRDMASRHQN